MNTTSSAVVSSITSEATKAAAKKENYTVETTAALLQAWSESKKDQEAVASLAQKFAKTTKSIIAKLSREKVYIKPTYKTKTGEAPISKEEIVTQIATLVNQPEEVLESLEKATKPALMIIKNALELQSTLLDDTEGENTEGENTEGENTEGDSFEQLAKNDGVI